ncbi:MAG: large conductance mechanosensitive channel protein MscL [Culicoidibacterales bacterium]
MKKQSVFTEFKEFISQGNVLDLAVAVILGGAFSAIIKSVVDEILMPLIGLVFGKPNFSDIVLGPLKIGNLMNAILNFLFIAIGLFVVVKIATAAQNVRKKEVEEAKAEEVAADIALLTEIRDLLKK